MVVVGGEGGRDTRTVVDALEEEEEAGVDRGGGDPERGAREAGDLVYITKCKKRWMMSYNFMPCGMCVPACACSPHPRATCLERGREGRGGEVQVADAGVLRLEAVVHLCVYVCLCVCSACAPGGWM